MCVCVRAFTQITKHDNYHFILCTKINTIFFSIFVSSWKIWACWIVVWRRPFVCVRPSWPWWGWLALFRSVHADKNFMTVRTGYKTSNSYLSPLRPQQVTPSLWVTRSVYLRLSTTDCTTPGWRGWSSTLIAIWMTTHLQERNSPTYHSEQVGEYLLKK